MNKISIELIENFRKIVLPFVSNRLYKTNFEGQGETDKAEFERDFNEILDLAISALNPTGDLISREALKDQFRNLFDLKFLPVLQEMLLGIIDNAPAVQQNWRFYYDHGYAQARRDFERPQGKWELHGMIYYCSECGHDCGESGDNFCGNCGADMQKG